MGESGLSMKLLVGSHSKRVLFAEADKECVDFLFYILTLPISTLIRLMGKQNMVGSLANLYKSIEALNQSYILPNKIKDTLLKPVTPAPGYSLPLLSIEDEPSTQAVKLLKASLETDKVLTGVFLNLKN